MRFICVLRKAQLIIRGNAFFNLFAVAVTVASVSVLAPVSSNTLANAS